MAKYAINGFGRIGRNVLRAMSKDCLLYTSGYDDNVNASNYDQQEAAFISTDIGASLANYDSVTQYLSLIHI